MAKKTFTSSFSALLEKAQTPSPLVEAQDKTSEENTPSATDLKIIGKRKTSSSQKGLPQGLTRMTFIVREEHQDKLKVISFRQRTSIKEILEQAIENYLKEYEETFGEIKL